LIKKQIEKRSDLKFNQDQTLANLMQE